MTQTGTVAFFDLRKGFGKIVSDEGGDDVFIHVSVLTDKSFALAPGERVEFNAVSDEKGVHAERVKRSMERMSGVVDYFDRKKGFGLITPDDGSDDVFVHFSDIATDKSYKTLEDGQQVDFSVEVQADGRRKALLVLADTRMPLERFAVLPSFEQKLEKLVRISQQDEDWNYKYVESPRPFPILYSYIHYTFKRLQEERKISETLDPERGQKIACFNTGLVTDYYDPIFAAFHENTNPDRDQPYVLIGFFTESQHPITLFAERPEMANYFTDPAELLYDRRVQLVKNVQHIIEDRLERFPEHLRSDLGRLSNALDIAISRAEQRVLRNYKTAIPQYNRGKIQLLLPLCLDDPKVADLALVVGKEGAVYKGYTVLTLDMAYNNARLLTRPDREWLQP